MFVFRKIRRTLFSCYLRFDVRPFALLPTYSSIKECNKWVKLTRLGDSEFSKFIVIPQKRFPELKTLTSASSFFLLQVTLEQNLRVINAFHATGLFLYPLKTSENQRFPDVFRGYREWHETGYFFYISNWDQASVLKVAYMFKVFGA